MKKSIEEAVLKPLMRTTSAFYIFITILLIVLGIGVYAFYLQYTVGPIVTGLRDVSVGGAVWGLYIIFAVYFIGLSFAGISLAATVNIVGAKKYEPVARLGEWLAIVTIILGALAIFSDLGRPFRAIVDLPLYARIWAPFFYTFSVVISGYLLGSVFYTYIDGRSDAAYLANKFSGLRRSFYKAWGVWYNWTEEVIQKHKKAKRWMAIILIPFLVSAHSFLGYIFGSQVSRPGWYSAIQPPAFVVIAGASGLAALIIIAAVVRKLFNLENVIDISIFRGLSNFTAMFVAIYLYFMLSEAVIALYAGSKLDAKVYTAIYFGPYAGIAWTTVVLFLASFIMIFTMFLRKSYHLSLILLAAILVNIAAITARYLIVVPSQTYGGALTILHVGYFPSWVEWAIIAGLYALGALIYTAFIKLIPIAQISEEVRKK